MKFKKVNFLICLFLMILTLAFTACSSDKNTSSTKVNTNTSSDNNDKKTNSNTAAVDTKDKDNEQTTENDNFSSNSTKNTGGINFIKKQLDSNTDITFNTEWKDSEDGNYSACIEGKGSEASEEGVGKIIIKNGQNLYSYEIENNTQISPKYIEWADGKNLLVIIASSHGTLAKGGDLYMLNVNTGEVSLLIKDSSKKQQIMSVQKDGNNINLKVNIYDDDAYNESHVEDWVINSFNTSLSGKIEVKNSDGKVVYKINE
ncbi:DUF4652 domain-containing protein [Clostridium sp. BJN0013]|uniref:DUF4652 domain-containing protein n=1 Tax=Clostridium sp. BJN0013 TaxID=3236840 RepID=UPI0034C5DE5D